MVLVLVTTQVLLGPVVHLLFLEGKNVTLLHRRNCLLVVVVLETVLDGAHDRMARRLLLLEEELF